MEKLIASLIFLTYSNMSNFGTPVASGNITYFTIWGGNLVLPAEPEEEGAVKRTWEDSDGNTKSKWEFREKDITGLITGLEFRDGNFWENLYIELTNQAEEICKIQIPTDSDYFRSFASQLKNIDLTEEVVFNSYDFTWEDGKRRRGMSLQQDGKKVQSYYYDPDKKASINGMPSVDKKEAKTYDKDDWKVFYLGVKKFLKKEVLAVAEQFAEKQPSKKETVEEATPEDVEEIFTEDNVME